jgi:hypothetical protein
MTWNFFGHLLVEEKITRMENGIQKTKKLIEFGYRRAMA